MNRYFHYVTPDKVKELVCPVAPRIRFDVDIYYDSGMYEIWICNQDETECMKIGHFPSDVAHIMLDIYGEESR